MALAFMFAVFLGRPCPFYILDEVEAALEDGAAATGAPGAGSG